MGHIGKNDIFATVLAMKIEVVALAGAFDTGLAAMLDAFTTANELAALHGCGPVRFDATVVGVRTRVRTAQGMSVPVRRWNPSARPDWVVVPAIGYKMPEPLQQALQRADVRDAAAMLRRRAARGVGIGAACIGTFVVAEAGLLDDRPATTTWWLAPWFRQRYPRVRLDESRMLVGGDRLVTAGAALSHVDLALWLIRQESPALAALTARYLIIDARPSQSAYAIADHLAHADPLAAKFEQWARARLAQGFSLDDAAAALATSKRTLARRLADALGKTPLAYFQELRVERAVHLLKTGDMGIDRIAAEVGYADGATLRTLLRRRLGRGVRELRRE